MGNLYAYFTAFSAALGGFLFGYEIGIISIVLSMKSFMTFFQIQERDPKTHAVTLPGLYEKPDVDGNIVLWFLLGCMLGAIAIGYLADKVGRKISIIIGSLFFVAGAVVQTASGTLAVLFTGRFIGGVGIGILSNVVPLYISETAPTNIRGTLVSVQQLMITIGILIATIINVIIYKTVNEEEDLRWRLALGLQIVPGACLFVCMFFQPYSPRWLASRDRNEDSLTVLAKMRRSDSDSVEVQEEYNHIISSIQAERQIGNASLKELLLPGIRNRVIIAIVLQFFQQFTGINVIMYFAPRLFEYMGFSKDTASTVPTLISAFVNVIATFPALYLVDRLGRRKLLVSGGLLMAISMACVTLFTKLAEANPGVQAYCYLGAVFIYLFTASFAYSWGPVVWVYQSEIFPLRVRAAGTAIATFTNWACNGIVGKVAPLLLEQYIGNYIYLLFAALGLSMAAFVQFAVPETKGFSLEDMDEVFDPKGVSSRQEKPEAKV